MTHIRIRKALPADTVGIAAAVAACYAEDFRLLTKDAGRIVTAMAAVVHTERFTVAEAEGRIVGIAACSDACAGRAAGADKKAFCRAFGPIRGRLAFWALKKEFAAPLNLPPETGFIEFVGVTEAYRGRGIAKDMLRTLMRDGHREYVLEVMVHNTAAVKCYTDLGFEAFIPETIARRKGRIFMRRAAVCEFES